LNGLNNADSDQIVVGGKYMFKDNIIAHAYAGVNNADNVTYSYADDSLDPINGDAQVVVVGTGLEYLF
jgi:uncharacterized NAD(P)/FAD-binding protein YdhS